MESNRLARLETYFEAVDDGDFERVAAQFTDDCRYVHDPRGADLRGSEAVSEFFEDRGEKAGVHRVREVTTLGEDALGVVLSYEPGPDADPEEYDGTYLSFARFADGLIAYYASGFLEPV
jgi:ketosteroid isomerase-like protein